MRLSSSSEDHGRAGPRTHSEGAGRQGSPDLEPAHETGNTGPRGSSRESGFPRGGGRLCVRFT